VPMIGARDLPAVGTVAPIETRNVTHVRSGKREDIRWFAVTGVQGVVDYPGLVRVLTQRAGSQRPSPHGVWLTATGRHAWAHVLVLVKACVEAGIYRVGVRVRSETTGGVMGFPLFIPPGRSGNAGPTAGRLAVRVNALLPAEVKGASDVGHIYAAVRVALSKRREFKVEKVVGKIWISPNTPLQYALTAIDLLYRAGCSGVSVQMSLRASWRGLGVVPVLEIQGGIASRSPQALRPPAVKPRTTPWPINGANEAGWVNFQFSDLPAIDTARPKSAAQKRKPRTNYAAAPAGVPPAVARAVDGEIRRWGVDLGKSLHEFLRRPGALSKAVEKRFAVAVRRKEIMPDVVLAARRQFPDATRVIPSALQFSAFLFHRGIIQGRADVTIALGGDAVRVIFGTWRPLDTGASITLVPFGVDPFAAGETAAFRIWFENLLHGARTGGTASLPLASAEHVLPYLPAVAQAGTQRALAGRMTDLQALVRGLAATTYDRVVLAPQSATATVVAGRKVVGTLTLQLRAEEAELRILKLTPRRSR